MPELPEVETIRRQLAPLVEGRKLTSIEILDPRWSRPLAPHELEQALLGRRIERLGRRGKYLVWSFNGDVHLAQHLRMTGAVLAEPDPEQAHVRVRMELSGGRTRRVAEAGDRRPAPLWHRRAAARLRCARGVLRRSARPGAVRRAVHRRAPAPAGAGSNRTDQGVPARPAQDRRRRQHLRRRGAVPGRRASSAARRAAFPRAVRAPARERHRRAQRRHRRARREHRRFPPRRRRARLLPGPVPRAPARGRAVREVRLDHRQDGRRRARHLRVRDLPAPPASPQAASSSSSRPLSAAACTSVKPPSSSPSTITCGKLSMPVSRASAARPPDPSTG